MMYVYRTIKTEVTNSLFSGYAEGLELAEFREDDGPDQDLQKVAMRAELLHNIGLLTQEEVSSEDGGSEQQGGAVTGAGALLPQEVVEGDEQEEN